jgi:hypothetical protein
MLKIEAIESGRLAPVPRAWSFESSNDTNDEEADIVSLLDSSDFFSAPEPSLHDGADRGVLSVLVELDGKSRRLTIPCGGASGSLAPLVSFIESRLQWRPRLR